MKLFSIAEVAEQLGVSRATITRMVDEGTLPAIVLRAGKRKRVLRLRQEVLDRWLLARERQSAQRARANRGMVAVPLNERNGDLHEQ